MNKIPLTNFGQVDIGDRVHVYWKGRNRSYLVRMVINKGTPTEEILINKTQNIYFIVSMVLDGTSWAKQVHFTKKEK